MTDDIKQHLAEAAINIVTGARRGSYGKPENNFGRIALLWQAWFEARDLTIVTTESIGHYGDVYKLTAADISPLMRLMKEARLCETPNHYDSHLDIIGYTMTGAEVNGVAAPTDPAKDIEWEREQRRKLESEVYRLSLTLVEATRAQPHASSDPETASLEPDPPAAAATEA